jgi:hypothetical protein
MMGFEFSDISLTEGTVNTSGQAVNETTNMTNQ